MALLSTIYSSMAFSALLFRIREVGVFASLPNCYCIVDQEYEMLVARTGRLGIDFFVIAMVPLFTQFLWLATRLVMQTEAGVSQLKLRSYSLFLSSIHLKMTKVSSKLAQPLSIIS